MAESLESLILFDQRGELNEFLTYQMVTPNHLAIHIRELKKEVSPKEKASLFSNGLKALAKKIETEANFNNTEEILAFSWAVSKFHFLFEGLGFKVSQDTSHPLWDRLSRKYLKSSIINPALHPYVGIEPSLATISREEFLKRYGSTVESGADSQEEVEQQDEV